MSISIDTNIFNRHTDSVLCCSIDINNRIAVSGGIDDTAYVWDVGTKHVIFECVGHKESVAAVAFSANSTYVATGDLNGYIQVRNTTTGIKIFDYDVDEINWILWHNTSEFILFAGTRNGDFWMWNVNDPASVKTFPSYGSPTTTAKLLSDGTKLVSAYGDGSLRVFDLKTRQALIQLNDATLAEIICIDLNPNNSLVAVGSIDSKVKLINIHSGKLTGTLSCDKPDECSDDTHGGSLEEPVEEDEEEEVVEEIEGEGLEEENEDDEDEDASSEDGILGATNSVENVLFSSCGNYLAASTNIGSIFIWDVATQRTRCELHTGIGITRCAWSDSGGYITGCLDGFIRIYDMSLNKLNEIQLHSDQILDIAYRNATLVTASEDRTCRATLVSR